MGSFSVFHWLILLIICVVLVVPYWRIFPRAGWPSALSLLMVVPLVNFVLLWILAFKKWPGDA
ncbi:hypothetical protein CN311_16720 [Mesorhizobium sanjuanii]|uniref:Uncharacterized protein n=1 Tax=Mesorhizobium sanjuanii TaxID=2037900 RepID=A0A2A6FE02_9HYPH|nr:hypothetical protein [Mesorhizobium sanjuanii]PDQ19972.1 hypothetical protein CN311_16720 [Mesorhizobium sanjuanii]